MNCPNCQQPATIEHLRNNPECSRVAQSFAALYRSSKRTTPPKAGPGRPKMCPRAKSFNAIAKHVKGCQHCSMKWAGLRKDEPYCDACKKLNDIHAKSVCECNDEQQWAHR
jgi:hypothetical protein